MPGYESVHAGAIVLGHDGELWGVESITHAPQLAVTLVRHGRRVTGFPPAGTLITVVSEPDTLAEQLAAEVFLAAGIGVEIVHESVAGGWSG